IARHPDAHALLVGGYDARRRDYVAELQQTIRAHGLENHVTLTGDRPDLKNILAASTVVLSLSTDPEAFGRTTLEALALGTRVIGYHHGGVAEQLAAIYPEGSVAVGDQTALARQIRAALDGTLPPVTQPLPERFTLAAMQHETLALYRRLAERVESP
ncbi:glycosyltransferase, partial [Hydrogenophilus hirschii]